MNKQDIYEISEGKHFPLLKKNKFRMLDTLRRTLIENQIITESKYIIREDTLASYFLKSYITNNDG